MNTHYKGRLSQESHGDYVRIYPHELGRADKVQGSDVLAGYFGADNGARLVACWNALVDVPNPAAVPEVVAALEECEYVLFLIEAQTRSDSVYNAATAARDALAKLRQAPS